MQSVYKEVHLDMFELEGRKRLLNIVATSILGIKSFDNYWERYEIQELLEQVFNQNDETDWVRLNGQFMQIQNFSLNLLTMSDTT